MLDTVLGTEIGIVFVPVLCTVLWIVFRQYGPLVNSKHRHSRSQRDIYIHMHKHIYIRQYGSSRNSKQAQQGAAAEVG